MTPQLQGYSSPTVPTDPPSTNPARPTRRGPHADKDPEGGHGGKRPSDLSHPLQADAASQPMARTAGRDQDCREPTPLVMVATLSIWHPCHAGRSWQSGPVFRRRPTAPDL